jgi:hypothetical protein
MTGIAIIIFFITQFISISESTILTRKLDAFDARQDQHVFVERPAHKESDICGIWFAPSSIPNAGLGVYAGRNFSAGEESTKTGDAVIPIVDMDIHQGSDTILWQDYADK